MGETDEVVEVVDFAGIGVAADGRLREEYSQRWWNVTEPRSIGHNGNHEYNRPGGCGQYLRQFAAV